MVKIYKCTIHGRIPSKKNSKQIIKRGGKTFLVPSKAHAKWHRDTTLQLKQNKDNKDIESITLEFWWPDNRKADLTNKAESVMDLMVDKGIMDDDCWQITSDIILKPKGIDRVNPRCEISIVYYKF